MLLKNAPVNPPAALVSPKLRSTCLLTYFLQKIKRRSVPKKWAIDTPATAIPVPTLRARRGVIRLPIPKPEIVAIPLATIETTTSAT